MSTIRISMDIECDSPAIEKTVMELISESPLIENAKNFTVHKITPHRPVQYNRPRVEYRSPIRFAHDYDDPINQQQFEPEVNPDL